LTSKSSQTPEPRTVGLAHKAGPTVFVYPEDALQFVTATTSFASTHRDEAEGPHLHGHTFHVAVTEIGVSFGLHEHLVEVASELHLHSLDDMLVGSAQDLRSMASWFMERLLMRHPRITRVEIWTADRPEERYGVDREAR
jgi:hypothetical protein